MSQLKVDSIIPRGGLPSGSQGGIIQIVQNIYKTDQTFSTTNSYIDTGLTCTITPRSSSNHILVHCQLTFQPQNPGTCIFRVQRGSTTIEQGVSGGGVQGLFAGTQDGSRGAYPNTMILDTGIATTSATTYKVQVNISTTSRINGRDTDYRGCSIMTLMEVSA